MKLKFRPSFGQVSDTFRSPCFGQVSDKFWPSFGKKFCFGQVSAKFPIRFGLPVSAKFQPSFGQVSAKSCFGQVSGNVSVSGRFRASFAQVSRKFPYSSKRIKIIGAKISQFVRPSPPRRGPSGRRGSGRQLEGPLRSGDGHTN